MKGARAAVRGLEGDVCVLETQPSPGEREPCLVRRLLGTEQQPVPVHRVVRPRQPLPFHFEAHRVEHTLGQSLMRLGVDSDGPHLHRVPEHSAAVAVTVRQTSDDAARPHRRAFLSPENRGRVHTQLRHGQSRAMPGAREFAATFLHRPPDQRLLLRMRTQTRRVFEEFGRRHTRGQDPLDHKVPLARIFSTSASCSGVTLK